MDHEPSPPARLGCPQYARSSRGHVLTRSSSVSRRTLNSRLAVSGFDSHSCAQHVQRLRTPRTGADVLQDIARSVPSLKIPGRYSCTRRPAGGAAIGKSTMNMRDRGRHRTRAAVTLIIAGSSVLTLAAFGHILNNGTGSTAVNGTTANSTAPSSAASGSDESSTEQGTTDTGRNDSAQPGGTASQSQTPYVSGGSDSGSLGKSSGS
jgi:hypothetical protein